MFTIDLWTDGSGTSKGPGGWAFVLQAEHPATGQKFETVMSGWVREATNNRMEMMAMLMGLREIKTPSLVVVHTDSEYLMKAHTEGWIEKWAARGWPVRVKNQDIWRALVEAAKPHILTFEWVKGHSGVELNELCDKLAGIARRSLIEIIKEKEGVPA